MGLNILSYGIQSWIVIVYWYCGVTLLLTISTGMNLTTEKVCYFGQKESDFQDLKTGYQFCYSCLVSETLKTEIWGHLWLSMSTYLDPNPRIQGYAVKKSANFKNGLNIHNSIYPSGRCDRLILMVQNFAWKKEFLIFVLSGQQWRLVPHTP